jgi:hypothetical protein
MDIDTLAAMMFEAVEQTSNELGYAVTEVPRDVEKTKQMLVEDPEIAVFLNKFATLARLSPVSLG